MGFPLKMGVPIKMSCPLKMGLPLKMGFTVYGKKKSTALTAKRCTDRIREKKLRRRPRGNMLCVI